MPLLKSTTIDPTVGIELEFDMSYLNSKRYTVNEFLPILKHIAAFPNFKEWYASINYQTMGYTAGQMQKLPLEGTDQELTIKLTSIMTNDPSHINRFCQDFFHYFLTGRQHITTASHIFSPIINLKDKDNKDIPFLKETKNCQDGGGIEFSFPPRKLDFYQRNKFIFENTESVMKPITNCDNSTAAGMHVHLGLDTFKQFGLLNFILFFYKNAKFIKKFAGRVNGHSYIQAGELEKDATITGSDRSKLNVNNNLNLSIINNNSLIRLINHIFTPQGNILGNYNNPTSDAPFKNFKGANQYIYEVLITNNNRAVFAICRKGYPTIECRMFQATSSKDVIYSRIELLTAIKNYCHTLYNYGSTASFENNLDKLDFDYMNNQLEQDLDINKFYQYLISNPVKYSHAIADLNTNYKEFFEAPLIESDVLDIPAEVIDAKKLRRTKSSQIVSIEENIF